jgi:hypothetical protein
MRTLTLRRMALVATVPLALSTLAACGDNSSSSTAADPAAPTSAATSDATTGGDPSGAKSVDPADFLNTMKSAAKAITTAKFTMNMDLSGQTVSAQGALDMTGDKPAMQLTMDLSGMGTKTEMRLVDGIMYIQDPTSNSGKYLKMDLSDPNSPMAGMGDALTNYDPQSMIDQMSPDAFQKVTDLGQESVGGQTLEHYRIVLDTSAATKMLGNLPSSASMPKQIGYDMWLDDQNRMAKFSMTMKKVAHVTATYTDYGADVNITAPDPADVVEMPSGMPTS